MGEAGRQGGIVDGRHDDPAAKMHVGDQLFEVTSLTGIEPREGGIEEEHRWVVKQPARHEQSLGLACREAVDGRARVVDSCHGESLADGLAQRLSAESGLQGEQFEELVGPGVGPGGDSCRHVADSHPHGGRLGSHGVSVEADVAGMQWNRRGQAGQERGLPRSGRSDHSQSLAWWHGQHQLGDHGALAALNRGLVDDDAVLRDAHGRRRADVMAMATSIPLALLRVSSNSCSGTLSATMPAPD